MHFLFLSDQFFSLLLGIYYWDGPKYIRPPHIYYWGGAAPPAPASYAPDLKRT